MEDQTNNRIREEWKEKFRKLWSSFNKDNEHLMSEKIEDLIDELLKSQREEMIEKIEKMIKIVNYQLGGFFIEEESYNEAIKDILYLIKNNG